MLFRSLFSSFFLCLFLISCHSHMASVFFFFFFPITISLSLSFLSIAFTADLHNLHPIPFTTHLVMTESLFASTITPSPSLSTRVSTKKKAILIRYLWMHWRDSGSEVVEETVAEEREEGDFGARLWVCLIWDGF